MKIAVAKDEAFCFHYEDNLEFLRELGAVLTEFSPLHDKTLPEEADGLILPGGYPELYAEALSKNESMRRSIREALAKGLPCQAECGGFLYLQKELKDLEGKVWPMAGVLSGSGFNTGKLSRFGYVTLTGGRVFGRRREIFPRMNFIIMILRRMEGVFGQRSRWVPEDGTA